MHRPTSVSESKQVGSAASWSDTTCFRARKMTLSLPFPKGHTFQAFGCEICLGRKLLCRESLSPCLCIRSRNASRFGAMALVRCITDYLGCCHGPDVDLAGRAGLGDHNDNFSILVKTFGPIRQGGVVLLLSRSLSFEVVQADAIQEACRKGRWDALQKGGRRNIQPRAETSPSNFRTDLRLLNFISSPFLKLAPPGKQADLAGIHSRSNEDGLRGSAELIR